MNNGYTAETPYAYRLKHMQVDPWPNLIIAIVIDLKNNAIHVKSKTHGTPKCVLTPMMHTLLMYYYFAIRDCHTWN